jgi:hypothetical protein
MTQSLNIHRHSDGSIDFGFYRRQATRRRRLAKRLAFRRCLILVRQGLSAILVAFERPMIDGSKEHNALRRTKRAGAYPA